MSGFLIFILYIGIYQHISVYSIYVSIYSIYRYTLVYIGETYAVLMSKIIIHKNRICPEQEMKQIQRNGYASRSV